MATFSPVSIAFLALRKMEVAILIYVFSWLVVALGAGPDLVGQGLRTLELCVDNLTADYLDPIMAPIMDDLMTALFEHLKPQPYQHFHSHTTMRILGKLGGRSRKFLNAPPELVYRISTDDEPSFEASHDNDLHFHLI